MYQSHQSDFYFQLCQIISGNNVHTCAYCGRFFAHKHVYESHVRTHTGRFKININKLLRLLQN